MQRDSHPFSTQSSHVCPLRFGVLESDRRRVVANVATGFNGEAAVYEIPVHPSAVQQRVKAIFRDAGSPRRSVSNILGVHRLVVIETRMDILIEK